jgi:hypothetical protein
VGVAVGLEAAKDIIADLDQALRAVSAPAAVPVAVTAPVAADAVAGPDYNDEGYDDVGLGPMYQHG